MDLVLTIAMAGLALGAVACFYRVVTGPTIPDRAVGVDTLMMHVVPLIILLSIKGDTLIYMDGVLAVAILSFVGTTGLAKFIAKGVIIDRDHR